MQYEWAQPGRLVVCVDDKPAQPRRHPVKFPVRGIVYTIRDVTTCGGIVGLLLEEVVNEPHHYLEGFFELSFRISRFRPVNTQIIDNLLKVEENA